MSMVCYLDIYGQTSALQVHLDLVTVMTGLEFVQDGILISFFQIVDTFERRHDIRHNDIQYNDIDVQGDHIGKAKHWDNAMGTVAF